MSSSVREDKITARVHVGGDSRKYLSRKETIQIVFDDFASLPHQVGAITESPTFSSHGRLWRVTIYPGGRSKDCTGRVGLYLHLLGKERNVKARIALRIPYATTSAIKNFKYTSDGYGYGCRDLCGRDLLLMSLNKDGALVAYVDIQLYAAAAPKRKPRPTLCHDMTKLYQSSQFKDVTFSVGGATFKAHRSILSVRAPALAALVEDHPAGTVLELKGIEAGTFDTFLRFLYSDQTPKDIKIHAFALLELADRFDSKRLKLLAELELEMSLDVNNAADLLLFADAKSCALLKESALSFIVHNQGQVMASTGWAKLSESLSLLKDIMEAQAEGSQIRESDVPDVSKMRVSELRELLEEQGLDVDGPKEVLVKRLQGAESTKGLEERLQKRKRLRAAAHEARRFRRKY